MAHKHQFSTITNMCDCGVSVEQATASMFDARKRVENYIEQRSGRRGLSRDVIHALDTGCPTEAELTISDLRLLLDCLPE